MIKNERQYQLAIGQITKLRSAEAELLNRARPATEHPMRKKLELDAVRGQLKELSNAVSEYEALKSGKLAVPQIRDLTDLPQALIAQRIAKGMTQRDLANAIGVAEQQIQRYEANNYASASLERLKQIATALEYHVDFPGADLPTIDKALKNIAKCGYDKNFFKRRLISKTSTTELRDARMPVLDFVGRLSRVFSWEPSNVFGNCDLALPKRAVAVSYKKPQKGNELKAGVLTAYASFCSNLILEACELRARTLPSKPSALRDDISRTYGDLSFESLAKYTWDRGIAILPIAEPGGFHAAVFRAEDGRAVVVLKQSNASRWAFDLLHELGHLIRRPHGALGVVDETAEGASDDEERFASEFASGVLLNEQGDELLAKAIDRAGKSLPKLKSAIQDVAERAGVDTAHLALHAAHRLAESGQPQFWGAAHNLSSAADADAPEFARSMLFERLQWGALGDIDRDILMRAIS